MRVFARIPGDPKKSQNPHGLKNFGGSVSRVRFCIFACFSYVFLHSGSFFTYFAKIYLTFADFKRNIYEKHAKNNEKANKRALGRWHKIWLWTGRKNNSKKYTFEYVKINFFGQTKGGSTFEVKTKKENEKETRGVAKREKNTEKRREGWKNENKKPQIVSTKCPDFFEIIIQMSSVERQNHRKQRSLVPSKTQTLVKTMVWRRAVAESARGVTNFCKNTKNGLKQIFSTWVKKKLFRPEIPEYKSIGPSNKKKLTHVRGYYYYTPWIKN